MTEHADRIDDLRRALRALGATGAPQVARLALWLADRPEEIAFHSVRGLADVAGVNANTVVRLARALGHSGYDGCRRAFQDALRERTGPYGLRAGALRGQDSADVLDRMGAAARSNLLRALNAEAQDRIARAVTLMLGAGRVHAVGVRSCFAAADYFSYIGRMCFDNVAPRAAAPGDIRDQIAPMGPGDVLLAITFAHYSVETVAAHDLALRRGASTIAITDSPVSPIARGSDVVLVPPMDGPQPMPSMIAVFALVEALVTAMAARSDGAEARMAEFERRLFDSGAYVRGS